MSGETQCFDIRLIVCAEDVREGDWVRWPVETQSIRLIAYVHQESGDVWPHSEWDDHEYELAHHQPVTVWRRRRGEHA